MALAKDDTDGHVSSQENSEGKEAKPSGLKCYMRVFSYTDNTSRMLYAISTVAAIAAGTALPLMDIVFGKFVTTFNNFALGRLSPSEYMNKVEYFTLYFVYLFIAKFVLVYVFSLGASIAAIRTTKALRLDFLQSLLRQDISFFDSKEGGSPSVKVTTNGNNINNGISDKLMLLIQSVSTMVSAFVVALVVQWKLALICICILPTIVIITGISATIDIMQESGISKIYSEAGLLAEEVFSSIATVHSYWLQPLMFKKYDALLGEAERLGSKKSPNYGVMFSTNFFCVYAGYGVRLILTTAMTTVIMQIFNITKAATAAIELFQTIDRPSHIDPMATDGLRPEQCTGNIELKDVVFSYPSRPDSQVLGGLSLSIPAGKTTALVGASGSGKSTCVALLERWYDQTAGSITLDGQDIRGLNLRYLRTKIRLVQQEPVLFSGTVFDNVAYGLLGTEHENASAEKKLQLVQDACKDAFAHEFVEQLPERYFTQIGERARMLSGGQKQRIAIARSIISNPPILLLDEATSALDPRAEKIVQQALDNVSANRTTISIAHKLSTIQKADNICVMSQGSLIEQGTHNELLARGGAYARLVFSQDLEREAEKPVGESEEISDGETNEEDDQHFRKLALKRTVSSSGSAHAQSDQTESSGTMGYGLLKCLGLLIKEQPTLWYLYAITAVVSILGGGTLAVQAILFSRTFNVFQMTGSAAISEGNFWALMFFVVALANWFLYFLLGYTCNMISQKVTRRYRQELFENTVKQPSEFFDIEANATGALTSRLARCATDLQELLSANAGLVINNVVTTISCAILGIAYGWKLGLVCTFGAMPPLILGGYFGIRISTKLDDDTTKRFAGSAAIAAEAVAAIRTVASLVLERTILDEYERRLNVVASRSIKSLSITMVFFSLTQSINFCAMALGFWYGGKLVSTAEYTTEQFFVVFIAVVLGGESVASFFQYSTSISKAIPAANYIFYLRTQTPVSDDGDDSEFGAEKTQGQPASVDIDSLEFAYPSRPRAQVIKNINVHVPAGRFVAFVGASGCGKSTMISLLARFYDPTSGSISINNQPIVEIGRREHRRRIALVQQEPVLYSGSIRENVSMGVIESMEPSEAQVEDALRSANILDFVKSLPEGLNTPLGNRGTQLSGGQRQRVAIARALIRNPGILLLDEATSALDTESEKIVQAALMEAAKDGGRTTVAVAHRLSTIKEADTICVFQAGKIIEVGNHESLIAERGIYFEMCKGQALDKAAT
ncbi:hypothetical protein MBLNU13_g00727t2 [Cladosporium sp. NU13]